MSERGSFVTQYIYCNGCLAAAKSVLLARDKYLCSAAIPSWQEGRELPIIAGKIGGIGPGDEMQDFELNTLPTLSERLCHPLRIAVLADREEMNGIYLVVPAADERAPFVALPSRAATD